MDYKNELDQVRALLRVALGNCDVALKQGAINASLLDCVLDGAERAVLRLRTVTEIVRKRPAEPGQKPAAPLILGFAGILSEVCYPFRRLRLHILTLSHGRLNFYVQAS